MRIPTLLSVFLLSSLLPSSLARAEEPLSSASMSEADVDMVAKALSFVDQRYLRIEDFAASDAFLQAAEAAEDAVPWLVVVGGDDGSVVLHHGEEGPFAELRLPSEDSTGLQVGLAELHEVIVERSQEGSALPEELDLTVALLRGLSRALDRHSTVLARDRLARFDERIKGKLVGIGARIGLVDGVLTIKGVFPTGPALAGGLEEGDRLVRIDEFSTVGMSVSDAIQLIRGPEDTDLVLLVERDGASGSSQVELLLTRAKVDIPNLSWSMRDSGVGVIKVDHFSEHTEKLTDMALADFAEAGSLQGVVIDLRGNSGGSMIQACELVERFVAEGSVILMTGGRQGEQVRNLLREFRARPDSPPLDLPVVVLTDAKSASASEIVAGAFVELDRGVLIGDRTYGKGTVQKLYTLRSGDREERVRFKLTVAEYFVGGDTPIEYGVGIRPDLLVERAVFDQGGVDLPLPAPEDQLSLVVAEEAAGWRSGVDLPDLEDPLLMLAEEVVLRTEGPRRSSALSTLSTLRQQRAQAEQAELKELFSHRDLDWRPAEDPGEVPSVEVDVEVVDAPRAGSHVEVRAVVHNQGSAPLYQVRVHLSADSRSLPWDAVSLPVGYLPPGDSAIGSAMVYIPTGSPDRVDEVAVTLVADKRPVVGVPPVTLEIEDRRAPPLSVTARLAAHEDHHRVELELTNEGDSLLTGLRAQLGWSEEAGAEILDERGGLPLLAPGESSRVDLALRLDDALEHHELPLELEVDAEVYGEVLDLVLPLPIDGSEVALAAPRLDAEMPLRLAQGPHSLRIEASDESAIADIRIYQDREKLTWRQGDGPELAVEVPVEIVAGSQAIIAVVTDDQGVQSRRVWHIYGEGAIADAEGGEDTSSP